MSRELLESKPLKMRVGEMTPWSRVLAAPAENLGPVPTSHIAGHYSVASGIGYPTPSPGLHGQQARTLHIHAAKTII